MSKKSKPIPAPPCGTWLKSHFSWDKVGGTCQVGWGKIVIPSVVLCESNARRKRERESFFFYPIQDIHKNDKLVATIQHRVEVNITTSLDSHFYIFSIYYELNF